jgi:ribosomal protein S18 acetylase RimI-like enzyme
MASRGSSPDSRWWPRKKCLAKFGQAFDSHIGFSWCQKRPFLEQYLNAGYAPKYLVTEFSEVAPPLAIVHPPGLAHRSLKWKIMADRRIRPAEPGDAAAVRDLVRAAYAGYVERIGKEPAPMREDYAALIRAGEVWVLAEGGEVLGVLVIRPAEDHMFLGNVAVAPGHQGRGLGRELVTFAEGQAVAYGLPEVRLYTNEKMHENLAVYARLGFEETGRGLDGGYRRVFMRKRLR